MLKLAIEILDTPLPKNLKVAAKFIVKMIGGAMKQLIEQLLYYLYRFEWLLN